jgi:hypothetical protein
LFFKHFSAEKVFGPLAGVRWFLLRFRGNNGHLRLKGARMEDNVKQLKAQDFVPLNIFEGLYPVRTELVYAQKNHPDNHFPELYDPAAKLLWVHKDILPVILLSSVICEQR